MSCKNKSFRRLIAMGRYPSYALGEQAEHCGLPKTPMSQLAGPCDGPHSNAFQRLNRNPGSSSCNLTRTFSTSHGVAHMLIYGSSALHSFAVRLLAPTLKWLRHQRISSAAARQVDGQHFGSVHVPCGRMHTCLSLCVCVCTFVYVGV